jgi:unsaturated rhamnogalacturonyl hydrolase
MKTSHILLAALGMATGALHAQQQFPLPTPAMQAIVDKDTSRHFGDAPADGGPYGDRPVCGIAAGRDRQGHAQGRGLATGPHHAAPGPHMDFQRDVRAGFMAASEASGDPKYRNAMLAMSQQFDYQLRTPAQCGRHQRRPDLS